MRPRPTSFFLIVAFVSVAIAASQPLQAQVPRDTINLREIGFYTGRDTAPVTVVEFSDFGCPFCSMFARGTYPELVQDFVDAGMVRWIFVPFSSGRFRNGDDAERAARCAAQQDRFEQMKEKLYAAQREWGQVRRPESLFRTYAAEAGLDEDAFNSCYGRNHVRDALDASSTAADALRIRATPTFLIDGRRLEGALPLQRFREVLEVAYEIQTTPVEP